MDKPAESVFDLNLSRGRVRVRSQGSANAPVLLCVHGISAHMHAFDMLLPGLVAAGYRVITMDLRGRGRSEITGAGSYGLDQHVSDVLEIADRMEAERFDMVGWSMGALIGIGVANRASARLRSLVLIDHGGPMSPAALAAVEGGFNRLDAVVAEPQVYLDAVKSGGLIVSWSGFWDAYYRYELGPHEGGFRATTSKAACMEDLRDFKSQPWESLWHGLTMPTLLLRCRADMAGAYIVDEAVGPAMARVVPHLSLVEVESNHFTVMVDPEAARAIGAHLSAHASGTS